MGSEYSYVVAAVILTYTPKHIWNDTDIDIATAATAADTDIPTDTNADADADADTRYRWIPDTDGRYLTGARDTRGGPAHLVDGHVREAPLPQLPHVPRRVRGGQPGHLQRWVTKHATIKY